MRSEKMKFLVIAFLATVLPLSAFAFEIGESEFVYSSDLAMRGFVPFATSSTGNASYGMTDGEALYLCFIMDQPVAQAERKQTLIAEVAGQLPDRRVPNIPIVCVLTQ